MKNCYINGISAISSQETFHQDFDWENFVSITENNVIRAIEPSYKEFIPPAAIRRMARGVKMGIATSSMALKEAQLENVDAIVTGTGMGCIEDSEKFLKAIIDNDEQYLTPTSFIQSTHNTVGAQIAVGLQCKGYNFTYVNGAISFELAALDALMQIKDKEAASILVGGIEELSDHTIGLLKLNNFIKKDNDLPMNYVNPTTKGVAISEGACFFVFGNNKTNSTYAKLEKIDVVNIIEAQEVEKYTLNFLESANTNIADIDLFVLGKNGCVEDGKYYDFFTKFNNTIGYKHLFGEFNTTSALGFWTACQIIKSQNIPRSLKINEFITEKIKKVLIYNNFQGKDHSWVLLTND